MSLYANLMTTVVTFEPADAPAFDIPVRLVYFTEVRGARIAFLEGFYDLDDAEVNRLKTGQVGRLTISDRLGDGLVERDSIPLGALTCVSRITEDKRAVRCTLVIAQAV